jgi:hypothetical protein
MLTDEQIQELVDYYVYIAMKVEDDIHIARQVPYSMKEFDVYLHEEQVKRSEEKLFEADLDEVAEAAEMLLGILDIELDRSDAQHRRFMLKLLQSETDINKLVLERKHGNWVDVPKPTIAEEKVNTPTSSFTMQDAVDLYIKGLDPKKVEEKKARSSFLNEVFLELIGHDTDAATVAIEHLLNIREMLTRFPRRNIQKYSEMPIEDCCF